MLPLACLLSLAHAASFTSTHAVGSMSGMDCRKATVTVTDDQLTVECKKSGFSRRLDELEDLRWEIRGGMGQLSVGEVDGDGFWIQVPKKEFPMLKDAMLRNLDPGRNQASKKDRDDDS